MKKTNWIILILLGTFIITSQSKPIKIIGTISNKLSITEIRLYKYENVYSRIFIAKIDVFDNSFSYSFDLKEEDLYLLENVENETCFQFILDNNVEINIIDSNFSKTIFKDNSSINTKKWNAYNNQIQELFFNPVRKIDTLILNSKKNTHLINREEIIDSLNKVRTVTWNNTYADFPKFNRQYVIDNPDSLVSLFIISWTGVEFAEKHFKDLYLLISDRLKMHSRCNQYK